MRILQVNTFDQGGGAENVVLGLHRQYVKQGHQANLFVKKRRTKEDGVSELSPQIGRGWLSRALLNLADRLDRKPRKIRGTGSSGQALRMLARPSAALERWLGHEDFDFPSGQDMLDKMSEKPDVVQAHNLHGNYFDLRSLPDLTLRVPTVLTLHDCWLMSGHCAHSFCCEKWRDGCISCPDISIYPRLNSDGAHYNWKRKRRLLERSSYYLAAPSSWLLEKAQSSILGLGSKEGRVIFNGIDDSFFFSPDKATARDNLGLPQDALILLFTANSIRDNEWKDFYTLRRSVLDLFAMFEDRPIICLALGDDGPEEILGSSCIRFIPFEESPAKVAEYYAAADLYLHAAREETFSLSVAEAMACGLPVVATAVGALPERVNDWETASSEAATGKLVAVGDSKGMTQAAYDVLSQMDFARKLGENASRIARRDYRQESQAKAYLDWFNTIIQRPTATLA
ncbi:putative Glycosyl transferase group 1 [Rhodospirillaceae bacterium LM-1]|nr:putative Glycosyl transferase group 1 [Rhodospirillaceae bacterium LM-1]